VWQFGASAGGFPFGRTSPFGREGGMPALVEGVTSSRVCEGASKLRKGACRREGLTSSCLPKGRCDVIVCSRGCFQASEGSMPKGRCDVIACSRGCFQASEGSMPKGRCDVTSAMWQWYGNVTSWKSRRPNGNVSYCVEQETRGPSYALKRLWRAEGMSDNSEGESQSPPSPHAFSGEGFESGSQNEDLGPDGESTGSEGEGEGLVVERSKVGEEEQSRSSGGEAYREMQRNYVALEACANRVLGITQAPEASASGRVGPSGGVTVVVAPGDVGVPVGVPLPKKNMMSMYELESLKVDYTIPDCVGLRLPTPVEAARYPPEGCVMVFSAMYKHGLRLPLHPWVQMMLSGLGYAPWAYNPNFWCILHGVYIAWWLAKRGEPSFEQFMHLYSVSRQQGNFGWVQASVQGGRRRDRAGEETVAEVPKKVVTVLDDSPKVVVDQDERQRKLRERREKDRANRAKKQARGAPNTAEGSAARAAEKRPRQEGDELLAELEKKRRGLESSIHDVMGGTVLPPFDVDPPPRLPLEMEELFPAGTEDTDFASVRREAKEVTLAMHRQEVPLVNAFLTGVKIDAGELARTKATDFSDRVQKTVLSTANAFGDMYLTLARAEREVALARRHSETAKAATAEAQAALRERNALQLKVGRLERELKETSRRLEVVEEARLETERRRTEELAVARAEAVEEYQGSEKFKSLVLDAMVEEQYGWEKMVARFNPELDINFDTSGVPPPIPSGRELLFAATPSAEATSPSEVETRGGADASGGESNLDTGAGGEEEVDDHADA
ncbi:unnamed protein product, partial [Prunus brigantina]